MRVVVLILLLAVTSVQSQIVFTVCLLHEQRDGASLVSVNSIEEHAFIMDRLQRFDGARGAWLTSGIVTKLPEGVRWLGDGTSTTSLNFWHSDVAASDREDADIVVYDFDQVQYGWDIGDPGVISSFICEIPLQDIYKIVGERRDFDYGLTIDNPSLAPQGPSFITQPNDTTVLFETTAVFLNCLAYGNPKPQYRWLSGDENSLSPLATGQDDPTRRFVLTGGRLTIYNPRESDEGVYQCLAYNEFGTILSSPVSLSFGSLGQFSNVPTATVYGKVSEGAVLVCPTITAKPALAYSWYKQKTARSSMVFIRPEFQPHTFISNSGKLYFSELAPSDDDLYYCIVSLTTIGGAGNYVGASRDESRVSIPFRLSVTTGVSSDYRPVIQDDFIKVYPDVPKRGQTIRMECFAYGTAPLQYRWYRYDRDMPRTATFSESNRVLTITQVQIEDSGRYSCRVDGLKTNEFSLKNYTLDVQSEPYFSYPLTNQHADIGQRLSWHCEARGKPAPTYVWYKNGQVLTNSTGVTIIGNTMVIDQAQKERDNGMYQCAARNLYGTSFSSAQIRVLELAPSFNKHPVDSSLSAAVGGNITIVCDPEAAPAPTYQWFRNNNDLGLVQGGPSSNSYRMLLNGNLLIENINNGHQGTYTCKATNSLGEDSSSGVLQVYPRVVISQPPQPVSVIVNESASIICVASAPPDVDIVYVWRFNGFIIDFEHFVEYKEGSGPTKGSLMIVGTQYKHEGVYTCQATTGMDSVSASTTLRVRGPPGEPAGVFKGDNQGQDFGDVEPGEKFVRIYWTDGLTHDSPIIAYTVEFRTNFDQRWRVHPDADQIDARFVQSSEYTDKRTVLLTDLKPNANHQFRVRAINQFGVGAPSMPSSEIYVSGSPPLKYPDGITGGGGKVGDLVIRWQPMPEEDYNGLNFHYVVYWRKKSTTQADDSRWEEDEVTPEEACSEIPDIEQGRITVCEYTALVGKQFYFMPYEVRMRGVNDDGDGVLSGIHTIMSAEEMPTATPRNVYSVSYNATALQVFWTPVGNNREEMKGRLTGYRINYWNRDYELEEQARFNIIPVPKGSDNIDHGVIIGLVPGEWYIVNVQAISFAGYGPKSENYPQETANLAPGYYPTEVHVYSIEGIGVRVNFRGISTGVAEEPLMGYKLQYWGSGENIRSAQEVDVGRDNFGTITNLSESVLYQLRIFGYSRGGQGKRSSPSVYFTVGGGSVPFNPETTEVMAGGWVLQPSLLMVVLLLCACVLAADRQ